MSNIPPFDENRRVKLSLESRQDLANLCFCSEYCLHGSFGLDFANFLKEVVEIILDGGADLWIGRTIPSVAPIGRTEGYRENWKCLEISFLFFEEFKVDVVRCIAMCFIEMTFDILIMKPARSAGFSRIKKIPYQAPPTQLGPQKCTF